MYNKYMLEIIEEPKFALNGSIEMDHKTFEII